MAWNTAVSFVTNTNWQSYSGESTMGHLVQMAGLAVQNFVSAAVGMVIVVALIRALARRTGRTLGNFWVDLTRTTTRILLPISFIIALALASQGVIQNFTHTTTAKTVDQTVQVQSTDSAGNAVSTPVTEQQIPGGPFASQEAIKDLGTNGGGPFNANSAHPFESPTRLTNYLEIFALLVIGFAFPITYGKMVGSKRQGRVVLAVMGALWLSTSLMAGMFEQGGNVELTRRGVDQSLSADQAGGNMESKEVRFGAVLVGPLRLFDDGHVDRIREQRPRQLHAPGRNDPARQHEARRGLAGRHGCGPGRHAHQRHHGGVHRRLDGGPNSGVPRQEDPGRRR